MQSRGDLDCLSISCEPSVTRGLSVTFTARRAAAAAAAESVPGCGCS